MTVRIRFPLDPPARLVARCSPLPEGRKTQRPFSTPLKRGLAAQAAGGTRPQKAAGPGAGCFAIRRSAIAHWRLPHHARSAVTAGFILVAALCFHAAALARAPSYEAALTQYNAGAFLEAAEAARALGSAEGLALAARARLAHAMTSVPVKERLPHLKAAEADARAALEKDESLVGAHVQLVVALGQTARIKGVVWAQMEGIPQQTRAHIRRAHELEPRNPWPLIATGAWNLEVARNIRFAARLFGASKQKGHEAFQAALEADPGNLVVRYQYALTLLSFRRADYRATAERLLAEALELEPRDAYAKIMQERSARLKRALAEDDEKALSALLAAYRGEEDEPPAPDQRERTRS